MRPLTPLEVAWNLARAPAAAWAQRRAPRLRPEARQRWLLYRIRALAAHAEKTVPFYQAHWARAGFRAEQLRTLADLERLPLTTKEDLLRAGSEAVSLSFRGRPLLPSVSGGTTGKLLTLRHDPRRLVHHGVATLAMVRAHTPYRPWHLQAYVYTAPYPLGSVFGLYPLRFLPTLQPPAATVAALADCAPHILAAYPSHLHELLGEATPDQMLRIRRRLRVVTTNSEHSTRAERDGFAQAFGVPVFDDYSTEELGRVAAECPHGSYHVFDELVHLEEVDGRLVGTNLNEWAMPILRYDQGDLGTLAPPGCACGSPRPILAGFEGRRGDAFHLPDGRVLTPGFLLDACYAVPLGGVAVRDYQLVLRDGTVEFHYVPDGKSDDERVHAILARAFATRGGANLVVRSAPTLPFERRGAKRRQLVVVP